MMPPERRESRRGARRSCRPPPTRVNLLAELDKNSPRGRPEVDGAPHEVLLVLDAHIGQNGLAGHASSCRWPA